MSYRINYPIRHIQQPTPMTCWSAAISMIMGSNMSAGPGGATLSPDGGLPATAATVDALARSYGLAVAPPSSWPVSEIARFMKYGPIVMLGIMPQRHAIVISGLDGDGNASTTLVTVHDPFQSIANSPLQVDYATLMNGPPNIPANARWEVSEYIMYFPSRR